LTLSVSRFGQRASSLDVADSWLCRFPFLKSRFGQEDRAERDRTHSPRLALRQ